MAIIRRKRWRVSRYVPEAAFTIVCNSERFGEYFLTCRSLIWKELCRVLDPPSCFCKLSSFRTSTMSPRLFMGSSMSLAMELTRLSNYHTRIQMDHLSTWESLGWATPGHCTQTLHTNEVHMTRRKYSSGKRSLGTTPPFSLVP